MKLTKSQADALVRIRDRGPEEWCEGNHRAGGAISRMFDRLAERGLCTKPPHRITPEGHVALSKIGRGSFHLESSLGRCFRLECSHGDNRSSWYVYRKVIAETSQVAECVRFEARSDGAHVLYLADPITKRLLEGHTEIKPEEFEQALRNFARAVSLVTQGRK